MRICRYLFQGQLKLGFYFDDYIVPRRDAVQRYVKEVDEGFCLASTDDTLALLPHGAMTEQAHKVAAWLEAHPGVRESLAIVTSSVELQTPLPHPSKILLLAGNYAEHIAEEGLMASERADTFPYVFSKPPTAMNHPGGAVPLPRVSPDHIDYEGELGVVIGRRTRHVSEALALEHVAGYTVVNDISDRKYKPFPARKPRERDAYFDWLHGKWHDGFCPTGPCILSSRALRDPQRLDLKTRVNGDLRQQANTSQMIFPVAAVIEFLSRSMTLEPGDLIVTGTPAGVGMTTGRYLRPGDVVEVSVEGIGTLRNSMQPETAS